jgi:signal peptidase II
MRSWIVFLLALVGTFIIDESIKSLFLDGYYRAGSCIDLELHINHGVAFSMFAFLGEYLKYFQALMIAILIFVALKERFIQNYALAMGFLLGGAFGNLYDRFVHGGVVDYVAWHCGFNYAVFNYADVAIDVAVVWIAISLYLKSKKESS